MTFQQWFNCFFIFDLKKEKFLKKNGMNSHLNPSIQTLIQNRIAAIKSQDVEKAVADYSNNLLLFDVIGTLSNKGIQAAKERLQEWFSTMKKLINYEIQSLEIVEDNHVAFCNSFNHIVAITKDENHLDMWWRETLGLKKENGKWRVVSAHSSVPFDASTGKASLSLKPF